MPAYFVAARRKRRMLLGEAVDCYSGMGILTSLPVLEERAIELPSSEADGGRRAQLLTVGLPGLSMQIANIHLTHLRDEGLRRRQLAAVLEEVQRSDAAIRVIGGDWNTPAPPEMIPMADCYVLGGGAEPRVSLPEHAVCVDHLFTLPVSGPQTSYPTFIRADVVLNEPDVETGVYPSDHFGIRVTLVTETK
jgi:endonuclease/exonuclease/phosphatase family metal-dependent hydrolase